ncbi:MAG: hypothetical protein ACREBG_11445 [Pyrinomonadaceae bacterium]
MALQSVLLTNGSRVLDRSIALSLTFLTKPGLSIALLIFATQLFLIGLGTARGQTCPDPPPQTSGSHMFRQQGESFEIPINLGGCQAVALNLRWTNGRNNGSNFLVTFLDANNQTIYTKELMGFLSGNYQFPFATLEPQPWLGSLSMVSVPTTVTIQTVRPFAFPASISYTVTRASGRSRQKHLALDDTVAANLRNAPGRVLVQGQTGSNTPAESISYRLEEVALSEPREVEIHGRKENVEVAYRLMLNGGDTLLKTRMIWLDDAAFPVFSPRGSREVGTLIYDRSVLRDGAEISMSNDDGSQMHSLPERLKLPESMKVGIQPAASDGGNVEDGNMVVGIRNAVRAIGATRLPLVQITLKTDRPFPARETALQLQIGRRFFLNELSGDHTGRLLTLTLTPEMFAELRQGAEIVAFFDQPDRSGLAGQNVWYFGRLNKLMLSRQ